MDINLDHTLRYKDCIAKYVRVKTVDKIEHKGWLKCIDPISGNLILITFDDAYEEVLGVVLIMGDAYSSLDVIKESDDKIRTILEKLYRVDSVSSPENVLDRKNRLVSWIEKNRLPVQENEDESLVVCENVIITPPYDIQNCSSFNGTVLRNVRQLVANLPN